MKRLRPRIDDCQGVDRALDGALGDLDAELTAALEAHAAGCRRCAAELAGWRQISEVAPSLRRRWDSPTLWPRIRRALAAEPAVKAALDRPAVGMGSRPVGRLSRWRSFAPVALAAGLLVVVPAGLFLAGRQAARQGGPGAALAPELVNTSDPLLTERAVDEVETAERQYVAAIERLSRVVGKPPTASAPAVAPSSPLVRSHREKLALIDAAIAELQAGIDGNRLNTHLRRELLTMYQEKQQTLRELMQLGQQNGAQYGQELLPKAGQ